MGTGVFEAVGSTLWIAVLALVGLLGAALALGLRSWWRRRIIRRRAARGRRGERRAVALLRSQGYRIVAEQRTQSYRFWVGQQLQEATVRADLLVQRQGRRYVVEVKTGLAADPTNIATRRQLLEYAHAYGADGVLLADM